MRPMFVLIVCLAVPAFADSPTHIRLTSTSDHDRAEQRHAELLTAIANLAEAIKNQPVATVSTTPAPPIQIIERAPAAIEVASDPCPTQLLNVMGSHALTIPSVYRELPTIRRTREVPAIINLNGVPTLVAERRPNLLIRIGRALPTITWGGE